MYSDLQVKTGPLMYCESLVEIASVVDSGLPVMDSGPLLMDSG